MYEQYWGLREKPFRKTPDPRYLFLNDTCEEALERLQFAVEEMELALLTGEVGSGKTLLTRALVDRLGERYEVGMILNPRLSPRQFLRTTASELGVKEPRFHSSDLLDQIHARLLELDEAGRAALLIIDEAHLIPGKPTFEEIRLLTNFQLDDRNLIAIVLVGQPELRERLRHRAYRALTQRIGVSFDLQPLAAADARAYFAHRLKVAGATRPLFSADAIERAPRGRAGHPARAEPARDAGAHRGHGARVEPGGRRDRVERRGRAGLERPCRGAGIDSMGRMADARKRARQKGGAVAPEPAPPVAEPVSEAPPAEATAAEDAAFPDDTTFPADEPAAELSAAERLSLPASGLAEDILAQLDAAEPRTAPVSLPASGLAEEILGRVEAQEEAAEVAGGTHSLSFFAAPAQQPRAAAEATEHLATFFLAGEEYGVEVRQVQEIRRVTEITSVPRAPEFIRGVINLRGRILPVLDLRRRLALGDVAMDRAARIVVVRIKERLLGLLVDGASQVLKVKVSQIEPPPEEVLQQGGDYIRGVAKLDDRLIILVDLERLLAHELGASGAAAPGASAVEVKDGVSQE